MNVQDYCAKEGARVFAAIYGAIKEHTLVLDEDAEGLAGAVANTHAELVARLLRERGPRGRPDRCHHDDADSREVAIDAPGV